MTRDGYWDTLSGKRCHDGAYWALMLIACVIFLVMNILTTYKEDDMAFALLQGSSLLDMLRAQCDHFLHSNGRFSDRVAMLFCAYWGKMAFNVCNTLVFGVMLHLLSLLVTGRRSLMVVGAFLAYVGWFSPVPSQTMLFLAGSCNYMWAVTASLLLVYYLSRCHGGPLGWGRGLLLLLCAAVAGNFNEGTSFGFLGGLVLYYAFNRNLIDRRVVIALAGYLLGALMIAASPAAWNRASDGGIVMDMGIGDLLASRSFILAKKSLLLATPFLAAVAGVAVSLFRGLKPVRRCVWTYVFISLMLLLFALGITHDRAYTALATVGFIITAMVLDALLAHQRWVRMALTVCCLAAATVSFAQGIKTLHAYQCFEEEIKNELHQAPEQAVLQSRSFLEQSRFVTPLCFDSFGFFLREDIYCAYYGKKNVQFVADSVYWRFHEKRLLDGAFPLQLKSDRPDVIDTVLAIPNQKYMVGILKMDTIPITTQQAQYFMSQPEVDMSAHELKIRRKYGIDTDYSEYGFYPLEYEGRLLLIFQKMDSTVSHITFPIDHQEPVTTTVTLTR